MEYKVRYLDHELLEVVGAMNGTHARDIAQDVTERRTGLVSHFTAQTYQVTLLDPRPSPEPIFTEAMARGVQLADGEVTWDRDAQAWAIHGVPVPTWMDANAPVQGKTMFMVATRGVDTTKRVQQVQITTARFVLADNVVDAINAIAMFEDQGKYGVPEIVREGALTFARYPDEAGFRFVACTSAVNDRLRIADVTGAVITA